jgi:hypothetical protein
MASGPVAKRVGKVMAAAVDEAEVRRDPAAAVHTMLAVGQAFLRARCARETAPDEALKG